MVHGDKEGEGTYVCEVDNPLGKGGTSSVLVRILSPPQLMKPLPKVITWDESFYTQNKTNSLTCTGKGLGRLTVRWDKDEVEINSVDLNSNDTEFSILTEEMEATNGQHTLVSVLLFPQNLTQKLDGVYQCTFSNLAGNTSSITKLYVRGEISD